METKIGVQGHLRYGKAAFVAIAYDDHIQAAYLSSAGALGTAPARRHYGESLEFVGQSGEYHWVAGNLMKYSGPITPGTYLPRKVEYLTVDSYSVAALAAPRPIFINGGTDTPPGLETRGRILGACT